MGIGHEEEEEAASGASVVGLGSGVDSIPRAAADAAEDASRFGLASEAGSSGGDGTEASADSGTEASADSGTGAGAVTGAGSELGVLTREQILAQIRRDTPGRMAPM